MNKSPEYIAWRDARYRCRKPQHPNYSQYGARGISVSAEWNSFKSFFADMGKRPSAKHSLDRIDNDGPYSKENCRWTTFEVQRHNSRSPLKLNHSLVKRARALYASGRYTQTEIAHQFGIHRLTMRDALLGKTWINNN